MAGLLLVPFSSSLLEELSLLPLPIGGDDSCVGVCWNSDSDWPKIERAGQYTIPGYAVRIVNTHCIV